MPHSTIIKEGLFETQCLRQNIETSSCTAGSAYPDYPGWNKSRGEMIYIETSYFSGRQVLSHIIDGSQSVFLDKHVQIAQALKASPVPSDPRI